MHTNLIECFMNIRVGTLAVAKRDSGVCREDDLGVCYEVYTLNGRPGYAFIFERGGFDGFSPRDVEMFLEPLELVVPSVASYQFTNVLKLVRNYRTGRFAEALRGDYGSGAAGALEA